MGLWQNWPNVARNSMFTLARSLGQQGGMAICHHPVVFDTHRQAFVASQVQVWLRLTLRGQASQYMKVIWNFYIVIVILYYSVAVSGFVGPEVAL